MTNLEFYYKYYYVILLIQSNNISKISYNDTVQIEYAKIIKDLSKKPIIKSH